MMNPQMNPMIGMLIQAVMSGANPMQFIQQMSQSNPQMSQLMNIVGGKSPSELQQIATNMAKQYGMTPEDVIRKFQGR